MEEKEISTGNWPQVHPLERAAKKPIAGAIDQSNQETLLGRTRPVTVAQA
ncbi:hypothetical protein P7266_1484 [Lactococcus cremoris]|nr:hypothetical protein P7266_1484 [Lactococcus cremoris]